MKLREVLNVFIFRFRHPNLMTLMGYCSSLPALVYPFMVRMSLFINLHKFKVSTVCLPTFVHTLGL